MKRVLFIGNSHTYYNDMPDLVRALWQDRQQETIEVAHATAGGVSLQWHWGQGSTQDRLAAGPWAFVILQERSGGPLERPSSTREYAGRWISAVRTQGATPILYMPWPARTAPANLERIAGCYESIGQEHATAVSPVGRAWAASLRAQPGVILHDEDGSHASLHGSYLAACCLFRTMTGTSLVDAWGPDGISRDDRLRLQAVADASVPI